MSTKNEIVDLVVKSSLKLAKSDWSVGYGGLSRFSGKTWPNFTYYKGKILFRDDNSSRPSKTYETNDISLKGIKSLLKHCSKPHPSDKEIKEFLNFLEKNQL